MAKRVHPPVVYIEWQDAAHLAAGWRDQEEMRKAAEEAWSQCTAAGFLVEETDRFVILAGGWNSSTGEGSGVSMIPRSEISKMVTLRKAREDG